MFFLTFAAVSLFGVAGLAETFPSFSISGPFLLDVPGFQAPSSVNKYVLNALKLKTTATVLYGHPTTAAAIFTLHVSVGNDLERIGSKI